MTRRLLAATRLILLVQTRARFPHLFAAYTVAVVALMLWVLPPVAVDLVLPALIVTELGAVGLMMVAAHRYLEIGAQSVSALLVSPLRSGEYLAALLLGSALMATVAGAVAFTAIAGVDARLVWMLVLLFPFAVLCGAFGFLGSLRSPDFPRFIVSFVPFVAFWQAPLLAVYDIVPAAALAWIPSAPAVYGIGALCAGEVEPVKLATLAALGTALAVLGFALARRAYERRIRGGLEVA